MSPPAWKALFNFTARRHLPFLLAGLLFSLASGVAVPVNAFIFGKLFALFTAFGTGDISSNQFKDDVSKYVTYILVLATGCWLFNFLGFFCWHVFGDLQACSARERLFNALLLRRIEWYDRRKDGVEALTTRILTYDRLLVLSCLTVLDTCTSCRRRPRCRCTCSHRTSARPCPR
jgi:ATP-binding cassette, subfamily B (MDR/TAP), member 1